MPRKAKRVTLSVRGGPIPFEISGPTSPLSIEWDPHGPAVYVTIRDAKVDRTREVRPLVMADYDADGVLVGFEVVGRHPEGTTIDIPGMLEGRAASKAAAEWRILAGAGAAA